MQDLYIWLPFDESKNFFAGCGFKITTNPNINIIGGSGTSLVSPC